MPLHDWSAIAKEQMNPAFARQVIHGEKMTIALVTLAKGSSVPVHQHPNEQICLLQSGRLLFVVDGVEHILGPGQAVQVPPNAPHRVEAIEESVAYDIFADRREDWIRGDDAYLRAK